MEVFMISEEDVKNIMASEGINCFNVTGSKDSFEKSMLLLEKKDMSELLRFMKSNNIKNAFYIYSYYDEDYFLIDEELTDKFEEDIYSLIEKGIEQHNKQIEKLDFSKPVEITIFCIYESRYIAINDYDYWCDELGAKERLMDLVYDNSDKIDNVKNERKLNEEVLKEEFKNFILNDNEFKKCTNQRLRRDYMYLLFKRDDIKKYKQLFWKENGMLKDISIAVNFIEMLWKEYKI
jgi:hypothetical protein